MSRLYVYVPCKPSTDVHVGGDKVVDLALDREELELVLGDDDDEVEEPDSFVIGMLMLNNFLVKKTLQHMICIFSVFAAGGMC